MYSASLKWRVAKEYKTSTALFYNCAIVNLLFSLTEQNLGSALFDDQIAFKIAEELEDWKERQQKLFKAKVTFPGIMDLIYWFWSYLMVLFNWRAYIFDACKKGFNLKWLIKMHLH